MQTSIKEKEICQNIFNWYDYYWKKLKKITYTEEDNELTKKDANNLLKNNNFTKKENNISNSSPEIKAKPKFISN